MEQDPLLKELHRKIYVTSRCRFHASYRLKYHHHFSQWTLALISVVLIILPLINIYDIKTNTSSSYFSIIQIVFAVLILVYSQLLGALSFELRADKLHRCGVELHKLANKVTISSGDNLDYLYSEYDNILDKYENHKNNDYLFVKLTMRSYYYKSYFAMLFDFLLSRFYIIIEYTAYLIIPAVVIFGVYVNGKI